MELTRKLMEMRVLCKILCQCAFAYIMPLESVACPLFFILLDINAVNSGLVEAHFNTFEAACKICYCTNCLPKVDCG